MDMKHRHDGRTTRKILITADVPLAIRRQHGGNSVMISAEIVDQI